MMVRNEKNKILVMMSTYNGEKYIKEQLESLIHQQGIKADILVRDDGSTDHTQEILNRYQKEGKLSWYTGKNLGPAKSFMNLLYTAPSDYDYYAFCDQDDYWILDKLKSATDSLGSYTSIPALYYCALEIVDSNLKHIRIADNHKKSLLLPQTLLVFYAPGCTMVFNKNLLCKLRTYKPDFEKIIMHDCWVYYACVAFGGKIIADDKVHIKYRQHGNNVIGASRTSLKKKIKMIKGDGTAPRARMIGEILETYTADIEGDVKELFYKFSCYPNSITSKVYFLRLKTNGVFSKRELTKAKIMLLLNSL